MPVEIFPCDMKNGRVLSILARGIDGKSLIIKLRSPTLIADLPEVYKAVIGYEQAHFMLALNSTEAASAEAIEAAKLMKPVSAELPPKAKAPKGNLIPWPDALVRDHEKTIANARSGWTQDECDIILDSLNGKPVAFSELAESLKGRIPRLQVSALVQLLAYKKRIQLIHGTGRSFAILKLVGHEPEERSSYQSESYANQH